MSKSTNESSTASALRASTATVPPKMTDESKGKKANAKSKQSRIVALLSSPDGSTIPAMMKATGWQQHSVRGFLAGVVRKKLKLRLNSEKIDGQRVYRIDNGGKIDGKRSKRRVA